MKYLKVNKFAKKKNSVIICNERKQINIVKNNQVHNLTKKNPNTSYLI